MITTIYAVAAVALLFVIAGVVRPRVGCSGACDTCGQSSCSNPPESGENNV